MAAEHCIEGVFHGSWLCWPGLRVDCTIISQWLRTATQPLYCGLDRMGQAQAAFECLDDGAQERRPSCIKQYGTEQK